MRNMRNNGKQKDYSFVLLCILARVYYFVSKSSTMKGDKNECKKGKLSVPSIRTRGIAKSNNDTTWLYGTTITMKDVYTSSPNSSPRPSRPFRSTHENTGKCNCCLLQRLSIHLTLCHCTDSRWHSPHQPTIYQLAASHQLKYLISHGSHLYVAVNPAEYQE